MPVIAGIAISFRIHIIITRSHLNYNIFSFLLSMGQSDIRYPLRCLLLFAAEAKNFLNLVKKLTDFERNPLLFFTFI